MSDTMPVRLGTTVIELARDVMACASPITGSRATGKVLIKSTRGTQFLPRNWPFIAIINGAAREELVYKTGEGPNRARYPNGKRVKTDATEPDAGSWWEVTETGTLVDVISVTGGTRHNLPAGTKLRFDPVCPLYEQYAIVADGGLVGGLDPGWLGGCKSMVLFETMGGTSASLDAFRSAVGNFPAVVIVWDGSEPADGTTQSSLARGDTRAGASSQVWKEKFNLFVLSKRLDSDHNRRNEGLKLLDDLTMWITDCMSVDGQQFSSPGGIQVRGRNRVTGGGDFYQQYYIYMVQISVTGNWRRYDSRSFEDWLLTHNEFLTGETDGTTGDDNREIVVNQDISMV